jgi:hypothetical protein
VITCCCCTGDGATAAPERMLFIISRAATVSGREGDLASSSAHSEEESLDSSAGLSARDLRSSLSKRASVNEGRRRETQGNYLGRGSQSRVPLSS